MIHVLNMAAIFHDVFRGFRAGRVTETAIVELNLTQELASVDQDPLFLVFLHLRKVYDNLYHGWLLKTLEGYGVGPKMWGIAVELLSHQEVFTQQNVYRGPQLSVTHGTTQGMLTSLKLFNVAVDGVVRH